MAEVTADDFRGALGSWASGVTVVSTRLGGVVYGITVSSFSSLSLDPPLVTVNLANASQLTAMVQESRHFGVSVLASGQEAISAALSKPGRSPSATLGEGVETREWVTGSPLVTGAIACLDCELHDALPGGDHIIAVGRVVGASSDASKQPLMYFRRTYGAFLEK